MAERRPLAVVVGAGVAGLCCALALSRKWAVTVVAPAHMPSASDVAAGMLAPAMEAALDPMSPPFPLLRDGLDAWLRLEARLEHQVVDRCGSLWLGPPVPVLDALRRVGAEGRLVTAAEARRLQPALAAGDGAVFAPEDCRLETHATLSALRSALTAEGAEWVDDLVVGLTAREVRLAGGGILQAQVVVVAAGYGSRRLASDVPELGALRPVKGQLVRFAGGPTLTDGAMLRTDEGYVSPAREGAVAGATMEAGRDDLVLDPGIAAGFAARARRLCPDLSHVSWRAAVGVRAATANGLPLVGRTADGVLVAAGFRRNGWLLAPLAAEMVATAVDEQDPGAWGTTLAPGRAC